jgi:uncharacterized protein (TIGR02266 family)
MLRKKLIRRADSIPTTRWWAPPETMASGDRDSRTTEMEREAPRFEARLVASVEFAESACVGFTENVSVSGAFVATQAPSKVGAEVNLLIALPDLALVRAQGTVRWVRPPTKGQSAGMGIRFEPLSSLDAVLIREFVKARQSKLLDAEGVHQRSA